MFKKIILLLIILSLPFPLYAANEWQGGTNLSVIRGTINVSDLDTESFQKMGDPLDRLLANYKEGFEIQYSSASQVTVTLGGITCKKSDGTTKKFRQNTSNTTVTWADIDGGAEAASTTYYVYANCDADAATATFKISTSSSTPTGVTSYKRLGQFTNDGSSNITAIINDGFFSDLGAYESKSTGVIYQATTDGFVIAYGSGGTDFISDGSSTPTTTRLSDGSSGVVGGAVLPVKKGDYWKVTGGTLGVLWMPIN